MAIPLRAEDGVEYRLFGIDAPELHQSCNEVNGKPWPCGRAAKAKLTTIINRGRRPVVPGNVIQYCVEKIQSCGRVWRYRGRAVVNGTVIAHAAERDWGWKKPKLTE
jgi:endonuclease YncB( thermonuclease family)